MIFQCENGVRPIRLSEKTREFAYESLHHKYGKQTEAVPGVPLDQIENFVKLELIDQYDIAIMEIAKKSPIRICANEKISGAATLGIAMEHKVPCTFNGDPLWWSISHLTLDFETVLKRGINGIENDILKSMQKQTEADKIRFLQSCQNVINAMRIWHKRYLDTLKDMQGYADNYNNLLRVPFEPARNFYEAVQSLWFTFAFVRLCGNWPGIGRIDFLLGDYLKNDIKSCKITLDYAREILAHFFIKGCEWIRGGNCGSGDAQHYQNIVLSGIDAEEKDITNEVTYLVLDIIEELGISDFPTTIRINSHSDEKFLHRVAEVIKLGGGVIAVYNEDLIIDAMVQYGYDIKEARGFANDGCWEVQVPGKTYFLYAPFDALYILQHKTLKDYDCTFASFNELYNQYILDINEKIEEIFQDKRNNFLSVGESAKDCKWKKVTPCTVVSVFEQGCIEKGCSYSEGGPVYNIYSPHIGGYPDALNSLYAIKKLVFDEKKVSFAEFMKILKNNWDEKEVLRQYVLTSYQYYGNDNIEIDLLGKKILDDFAIACRRIDGRCGYLFPPGVSTFGRQIEWANQRLASPHGYKVGAVLAPNCSPTPSSDKQGASAIIRSYCRADLKKMVTGAALDLKLLPSAVEGEDGINAIIGLLRGFVKLGGFFMQPDVVNKKVLRQAQLHPEDYQTLSVRVSGWNARFVTLNKEWQDMVIDENK